MGTVDHVALPSDLTDGSYLFARLVSGEEGVLGEVPPRYQAAPAPRE